MVKAAGELCLIISFICKRPREDVSFLYFNFLPLFTPLAFLSLLHYITSLSLFHLCSKY